jgi:hypothetical protein
VIMKNPESRKFERGEMSLLQIGILLVVVFGALMVGLMSFVNQRNMFAELWDKAAAHWATETAGKLPTVTGGTAASAPAPTSNVRKCIVNGKVTYSNVECGPENKSSRQVDVRPTEGLNPAGAPPKKSGGQER